MKIKPMLGGFALDNIEYIESSESRALVEHRVPGLAGNYFQDMGTVPNTIVIIGTKHGDEARDSFLESIREIFNAGEPTTFVADINTASDLTEVVIEDLEVAEIGGSPDSFRYLVKLRQYIEPPEPPSTGLLDVGILDDALKLTDVLDVLDALDSIPNLGDPTPPLTQALDSIESITSGLETTVTEVSNLTQSLPTPESPTDILAPVLGDEAAGTGVAGVLKLLEEIDTSNLSVSLTADLDEGFSASISVDADALTGEVMNRLQEAVGDLPEDPALLIEPLATKLEEIQNLSSADLSEQLLGGLNGLQNIETLIPADTSELVAAAAERMSQLKGEFISGEFAELRDWSENVRELYAEIEPLLTNGAGTVEERLLSYLHEKISDLVEVILPEGNLALNLAAQMDGVITADLLERIDGIRVELIEHLNLARVEFEAGNFTNTTHVAAAQASFQQLTSLLAEIGAKLKLIFDQDIDIQTRIADALKQQFDNFLSIEIIDLGNIKDKFSNAIGRIVEIIEGLDLEVVRETIEGVFEKINDTIGQFDLSQITANLSELQGKLQSVLDGLDGTLFEVIASIRNVFTQIKDGLQSVASTLGSYDENGEFKFNVQEQIESFLNGVKATLQDTIQPLLNQFKGTVGQTLEQVQGSLNAVKGEIETVKAQLESALQGISGQLQSLDVAGTMEAIGQKLEGMLGELGTVDFDVVVDPVIAQINEMRDALAKIDISAASELTVGALKVSVEVVVNVDFSAQITGTLMAKFDEILQIPQTALGGIEASIEGALEQLTALEPSVLLTPLDNLFAPITTHLEALDLEVLLKPLDDWYLRLQEELNRLSPAALLEPLIEVHGQLQGAFEGISPAALIQPLQGAIDGVKAEIQSLDITDIATELGGAIDQVKELLTQISPEGLLNPLVNAFDKIMGALDSFDPTVLLQPFADIFAALATPLANLTEEHAQSISEAFAVLRGLIDAFNPRFIFETVQQKALLVNDLLQQLNIGGIIASLKTPYDAMNASFVAQGGPANVSLSASVEGLNPLRDPAIGAAASDFQRFQSQLSALAQAAPPTELVSQYDDEIKPKLESLIPIWVKENISAASIRRAFEVSNPLNITAEVNQVYEAIKQQIDNFNPRIIQENIAASFEVLSDSIFALDPAEIVGEVQGIVDLLLERLDVFDLQLIAGELEGVVEEIETVIAGLDPKPIIELLQGLVDEVMGLVEALQPSEVLSELNVPFQSAKEIVSEFSPAGFKEPLQVVFEDIQSVLEEIDIGIILQPLSERLEQLRDELDGELKRTETAFNDMLATIPT